MRWRTPPACSPARTHELERLNVSLINQERETQAKTAALVALEEEMRLQAEQDNAAKSKFLAEAAHDLRQPMQALANLLEAAQRALAALDPGQSMEHIVLAQEAARLARTSFNAVLDISRLESGFVHPEYAIFEVHHLIDEVLASLGATAESRPVWLRLHRSRVGRVFVRSDRHLLGRAVLNLVANSIKYADPAKRARPQVVVGVVALADRVRLEVVDNGVGIARDKWREVFKPFVQLDNPERDRNRGVGLGLSIVKAIVDLLEGHRIELRSAESRGTRISLTLPAARSPVEQSATDMFATKGETEAAVRRDLDGLYVVYVEDDTLVRRSTAAVFASYGVLYEAVASFAELESLVADIERTPDVLVSDYRLAGGRTALDAIALARRAMGAEIPAIVVSGETVSLADGESHADVAFLKKPVSPTVLLDAIASAATRQVE